MSDLHPSIFSSPSFNITGPGGTTFNVHSALISEHSKILEKIVNGNSKESADKAIHIKDIDGDIDDHTIARFVEWCYASIYTTSYISPPTNPTKSDSVNSDSTGFWNSASRIAVTVSSPAIPTQVLFGTHTPASTLVSGGCFGTNYTITMPKGKAPLSKKTKVCEMFLEEVVKAPLPRCITSSVTSMRLIDSLCHARLYVFANRFECEALGKLALINLRKALATSQLEDEGMIAAFADLIRYTYAHTLDYETGYDQLRAAVTEYAVCHLEKVVADKSIMEFMKGDGAFACELMIKSMARLD